ncbi:MAG: diadenylate cyclase CdaA [Endomicrobia bacterium]|nr:diadenylate cyclase CdaA [Endomicrobiia bacterium]
MLQESWQKYIIYILDISIVIYALYKFLVFIRGTKAINIFYGVLFVGLFSLVSIKLNLPITSWFLKQFWLAGVIVLAVVFQPELRNVLSGIYLPKKNFFSLAIIEEIISAVKELKENKYGALIVIERNIGLKDFIQTGVILNADISKDILISIFYPKNPLHDGAVIISKGKIFAARCILPLSEERMVENLGTRHRAALGIAQTTDAIALVVSEERGTVTFVNNKNFCYNISVENLRELLNKKLTQSE